MKENTQEKSLVQVNENSIFYKIKSFFRNLFHKQKEVENIISVERNSVDNVTEKKSAFIDNLKNIKDEETILLKLQQQYRNGEIKEEDLTEEQKKSLYDLYDKQIANLKKSNEFRKNKILQYRKTLKDSI